MATILIVEDNLNILENLKETLEFAGYSVLMARDGQEGLELAQAQHPDLIISDIVMPKVDGFDLLRAILAEKTTESIPVIFTTALADKSSVREGMNLGAADYITKPFHTEDLLNTVSEVIKAHGG